MSTAGNKTRETMQGQEESFATTVYPHFIRFVDDSTTQHAT